MFNLHLKPNKLPNLETLTTLTNNVGIVQHTRYQTPDFRHGYCLDDNARALVLLSRYMSTSNRNSRSVTKLSDTYLSYINLCQRPDGWMHNFISFDNHFLDEVGSEDSFGRAIWGLGECAKYNTDKEQKLLASEMLMHSLPRILELRSPRAIAYCLLGLVPFYTVKKVKGVNEAIKFGSATLSHLYEITNSTNWHWFEHILAYSNALLPMAMLMSAQALRDHKLNTIALESFDWLLSQTETKDKDGLIIASPIGNRGWYPQNGKKATLDQQPIDVSITILAASYFYDSTGDKNYKKTAYRWFEWFVGKNIENIKVANFDEGFCYDGLQKKSTSQNHGAESVIAFLLAQLEIYQLRKS